MITGTIRTTEEAPQRSSNVDGTVTVAYPLSPNIYTQILET